MIKHTLTKKQQLVLCAMYVESLGGLEGYSYNTQAFKESLRIEHRARQILICLNPRFTCSQNTINYLQSYGLVGSHFNVDTLYYCLTSDGVALAKALFKVLS